MFKFDSPIQPTRSGSRDQMLTISNAVITIIYSHDQKLKYQDSRHFIESPDQLYFR
jgi:hypothetical protein